MPQRLVVISYSDVLPRSGFESILDSYRIFVLSVNYGGHLLAD